MPDKNPYPANDFLKELFVGTLTMKPKKEVPAVKRIIYNNPATIVFWQDRTKTVVKCMDGEPFEKYAGFCAALAKKVFGSTSKAKKVAGAKEKHTVAYHDDSIIDRVATTNAFRNESLSAAIDAFSNSSVAFDSKNGVRSNTI